MAAAQLLLAFLYQLKQKAIRGTKSPCCTLLVLRAEGPEEQCRKQAAVILIACLASGYRSELQPKKKKNKNIAVKFQCNFSV